MIIGIDHGNKNILSKEKYNPKNFQNVQKIQHFNR